MKIFKKHLAGVCAVILLFQPCLALSKENSHDYAYEEFVMRQLNIPVDGFKADYALSRADAAAMLAAAIFGGVSFDADSVDFDDVNITDQYAGVVCMMSSTGLMKGNGRLFEPNRDITYAELLKISVAALGFEIVAEQMGGYPIGYINVGVNGKLTKGVNLGDVYSSVIYSDFIKILYNFMNSYPLVNSGVNYQNYRIDTNETLLEKALERNNIKIHKGIVTANSMSLGLASRRTGIEVDGTLYDTRDRSYDEYLGCSVYVSIDTESTYIKDMVANVKVNQTLVIDEYDLISISLDEIIYSLGEKNTTEKFNSTPVIVRNNVVMSVFTDEDLKSFNGNITLLDNNYDENYDYVFISSKEYFEVSTVSLENNIIFLKDRKYNDSGAIYVDTQSSIYFHTILNTLGEKVSLSDISAGNIISISGTDDLTTLQITLFEDGNLTAAISSIDQSIPGIVTDDGVSYNIAKDGNGTPVIDVSDLILGAEYSFVADGKIIARAEKTPSGGTYGVVVATGTNGGLSSRIMVKFVSEDKNMYICELADRVNVNGKTMKKEDVVLGKNMPFLYELNIEEKIAYIEVAEEYTSQERRKFNSNTGFFTSSMYNYPVFTSKDTRFFVVPTSGIADDYMSLIKLSDGTSYTMRAFDYDEETKCVGAVVLYLDVKYDTPGVISSESMPVILKKVSLVINEEDEAVYKLTWIEDKEEMSAELKSTADLNKTAALMRTGDVFRYSLNSLERVDNIDVLFKSDSAAETFHLGAGSSVESVFGWANYAYRMSLPKGSVGRFADVITLGFDSGSEKNMLVYSEKPIYYYLYNSSNNSVKASGIEDIVTENTLGAEKSGVFIYKVNDNTKAVVIVN